MADRSGAIFPLRDCHPSILQRIFHHCHGEDLIRLRQVNRTFRDAIHRRMQRVWLRGNLPVLDVDVDLISKLPNLVFISLRRLEWSADDINIKLGPALRELPHLRELEDLPLADVDPAATWLPALQQLTRLRLKGRLLDGVDYVPDQAVLTAVASHCSSLQLLEFIECELHWAAVHATVALVSDTLTGLNLAGCCPEDVLLRDALPPLGLLPLNTGKLRELRLELQDDPGPVDGGIYSQLATFVSLTNLDISNDCLNDEGIENLNALKQLTALRIAYTNITTDGVAKLTGLSRVQQLRLTSLSRRPPGPADAPPPATLATALAGFRNLIELDISARGGVELDGGFAALSGLTKLTARNAHIFRGRALEGLAQLRCLDASDCLADEADLAALAGLSRLSTLILDCPHANKVVVLSCSGVRLLAGLPALHQLGLAGMILTACGLEQLASLKSLRALDLSRATLPRGATPALLAGLQLQRLQFPSESQ